MQEIVRSDSHRNRDLLEVVIQKKEQLSADETRQRLQGINDELSGPSSFVSKQSATYSKDDCDDIRQQTNDKIPAVQKLINSLGVLCIANLIFCVLTLQIIITITENDTGHPKNTTLLSSRKSFEDLLEVTSAFASFVLALDMCSLMICCMQLFFASKILTVQDGGERAAKYLADCSSSRFVAILGFFISVPSFFMTVICYVLMRMRSTPAITVAVILSIGILICGLSIFQNVYHWQDEIGRAYDGRPVYEDPKTHSRHSKPVKELNTLV